MPPKRTLLDVRMGSVAEIDGILQDESIHEQTLAEQELLAEAGVEGFEPLDMKLRLSLIAAVSVLVDKVDAMLRPWSLSGSTFNVLMTVRHAESGTLSMSQIADLIVTRPRNVTPLIDALVAAGYLERRPSETDRRVVYVALTKAGAARLDELLPELFRKLGGALEGLSDEEKAACIAAVTKVRIGAEEL
jgi:MarR family transcriptional regulator, 2-MHQ and catechol-resistance regulon repressor